MLGIYLMYSLSILFGIRALSGLQLGLLLIITWSFGNGMDRLMFKEVGIV